MLNQKEQDFLNSIENKIKKYKIKTTLKEAFSNANRNIVETRYNDGKTEYVDAGIETFLVKNSFMYFLTDYCFVDLPGLGTVPMEPYYFQYKFAQEIEDYQKVVAFKTRQCLTEKNFVMTNKGYVSIKDVKIGDKIETVVAGQKMFVDVKDSFYTGKKEVCRILTNAGSAIECTLDHKIFTNRGWVEAGDITLKDEIVSIISKGDFGDFYLDDDSYAAFIGYYLADGRYDSPSFVNTNYEYILEMSEIGKKFENCSSYIYERNDPRREKQGYDVKFVSKGNRGKLYRPVKDFIHRFGLDIKSENRILTNELLSLNKKQMSILINRLYSGDGWISYKKDKRRKNYIQYEIGIGSPSFTLIKQLEYILQTKYGIHCFIYKTEDKRNKNGMDFWRLRIEQKKSVLKFIEEIGIKGKTDRKEIIDLIQNEKPYKTNQSFEKVRKIQKIEGLHDVYDITTETSSFLTNGLLVHNCGFSTITSLYSFWKCNFYSGESIDIISKKQLAAQLFVERFKSTMRNLPDFLKTKILTENTERLVLLHPNGAKSQILSEAQSENAGRGDSLSLLIMDEVAHYQSDRIVRKIISAASPALSKTGGRLVIISTPNSVTGPGAYYYEQVQNSLYSKDKSSKLVSVDWWEIPDDFRIPGPKKGFNHLLEKAIKEDYYNKPDVKQKYNDFFSPLAKEKYYENEWLKKQYQDLGEITYFQEILHEFITSGNLVFNKAILKKVESKLKEPVIKNTLGNMEVDGLWIWKPPVKGRRYILAGDTAKGTSNDYSTLQVFDVENYEQVCEFKNLLSTPAFARLIKIVARYYNEAFVVIESNGVGEAVFTKLYYDEMDPYKNMYKEFKTNKKGEVIATGWTTNIATRKLLTNNFIDWITVDDYWDQLKIYSKRLFHEMTTWIYNEKAQAIHSAGAHDDAIFALALCLYLRDKAVNAGESFLIAEDGALISYNKKDASEDDKIANNYYSIMGTDFKEDDRSSGMDLETYKWLIG